jgi:hypothetical protein
LLFRSIADEGSPAKMNMSQIMSPQNAGKH